MGPSVTVVRLALLLVLLHPSLAAAQAPVPCAPSSQRYSVIELQPRRHCERVSIGEDGTLATVTLIDLNPTVGAWYVLTVQPSEAAPESFHLERPMSSPVGGESPVTLRADGSSLELVDRVGRCQLWSQEPNALRRARTSGLPYAPLCDGRWYLRNVVPGTYTPLERVTQFLRDHVWQGDKIVNFVREQAFRDAFAEHGAAVSEGAPPPPMEGPAPGEVRAADATVAIEPEHLALDLGVHLPALLPGQWYPVRGAPGIFASVTRPQSLPEALLQQDRPTINPLDRIESAALDYLVAMDLRQFELHFEVGTDEPGVAWSERVPEPRRTPALAGPDGIDTIAPLARTGMVSPALTGRVAATFAGGFKRTHGAFLYGPLALKNAGSHYGFMQQGVILSRLQPGLATVYRTLDGTLGMKTWQSQDDAVLLDKLVDARQNGVALIDFDAARGLSVAGPMVAQWGAGNWSGSSEKQLRTLRAGLCLQVVSDMQRYLVFGYFSTATPSAMARVFQSYHCRYAMQLDINALEHTYFALYTRTGGQLLVQHLIEDMEVVDRKGGADLAPRFIGFPDDRDFFYLVRRPP